MLKLAEYLELVLGFPFELCFLKMLDNPFDQNAQFTYTSVVGHTLESINLFSSLVESKSNGSYCSSANYFPELVVLDVVELGIRVFSQFYGAHFSSLHGRNARLLKVHFKIHLRTSTCTKGFLHLGVYLLVIHEQIVLLLAFFSNT